MGFTKFADGHIKLWKSETIRDQNRIKKNIKDQKWNVEKVLKNKIKFLTHVHASHIPSAINVFTEVYHMASMY